MSSSKKRLKSSHELRLELAKAQREKMQSFKAKMDLQRKFSDKVADFMTDSFGTVSFLCVNIIWFTAWISINTGLVPLIPIFDPFPFGLLTTIVSLEAIFLAIVVLISQNRSANVEDLREEIDLQINVKTEEEVTKILIVLDRIHDHLGLPPEDDVELIIMKQKTDLEEIEKRLTKEMLKE